MKTNRPKNLIIAGLGGQGVFTLTKTMWLLCERYGIKCQSSTFKGGAQKHGSIHSVLRIFISRNECYERYSTQILPGDLDIIIGMEPWETVRYCAYFSKKTSVYTNTRVIPFYMERKGLVIDRDPLTIIGELKLNTVAVDFTERSKEIYGTEKMANYLLGKSILISKELPFTVEEYNRIFAKLVRIEQSVLSREKEV